MNRFGRRLMARSAHGKHGQVIVTLSTGLQVAVRCPISPAVPDALLNELGPAYGALFGNILAVDGKSVHIRTIQDAEAIAARFGDNDLDRLLVETARASGLLTSEGI
jgi:hypothetical protein